MTIIATVKEIYDKLDSEFNIFLLILKAREYQGHNFTLDSTILRRLNELRNNKIINYKVLNKRKGIYKKL